ncbi:MAG: hypothetical protein QOF68_1330 [Gaiellales bacterium]|jgi:hypothetical protein|nr:hypothetical protein [Gaiellales bacterium]
MPGHTRASSRAPEIGQHPFVGFIGRAWVSRGVRETRAGRRPGRDAARRILVWTAPADHVYQLGACLQLVTPS